MYNHRFTLFSPRGLALLPLNLMTKLIKATIGETPVALMLLGLYAQYNLCQHCM